MNKLNTVWLEHLNFKRKPPKKQAAMELKLPAWQRRDDLFIVPQAGWVLVSVLLLTVFLAGGRPLWAQGVVTMGVSILWAVWTPSRLPSKLVVTMLVLLAVTPLAAYLPGAWLAMPAWRAALTENSSIIPSVFVTPQPWLTLHVYLLWLTGLALAAWCACQEWDHYHRGTLARMYAGGLLAITLFAIFGVATGYQPSWWKSTDGFGPFLNRNQWGATMGFGAIVCFALIHQCVRQEYKQGAIFWALAAAVFIGGAIYNESRGGLVIALLGGFTYWAFYGLIKKQYRYAAIGISFLLIAFALFALGGGALLERFVGLRDLLEGEASEDLRLQFYRMTLAMVAGSPLAGFGLGNFEYVFPFYLDFEPIFDRRPAHPESSWLWLASEGGWLLLVVVAVSIVVLIVHSFSVRKSRATTIRAVGMACALMMALSAGFEVNAHRLGTLFPVIMLATLALPPAKGAKFSALAQSVAKAFGALLFAAGFVWLLGGTSFALLPAVQGTSALQADAFSANESGRGEDAITKLERCKRLRPLDWNVHWTLSDWLLRQGKIVPAWEEFRAANALLPYLYWTVQQGAEKWINPAPGRATMAMLEAMSRAPESKRAEIYAGFLQKSSGNPALRSILLRLFPDQPEMELVRINQSTPEAAGRRLSRLIARTDNLASTPEALAANVLRLLLQRNQIEDIDRIFEDNPRLKRVAWDVLVERELRSNRKKEALDVYFDYAPRPVIPAPINRSDLHSVERAAALAPLDLSTSIAYFQVLDSAQREDDALWQLRRIMELPNAPPYIWYLAAEMAHRRGDPDEAWTFLRSYQERERAKLEEK
jgi:hypothetical protein